METSTGLVSEARKMRVSLLVLVGVIAVWNTDARAKAVASVTEDEANSVGQSPVEPGPQNDTAYETTIEKSDTRGGEHTLIKRQISSDPGKRRSVITRKFDKTRKTESKKVKHEESKMRTVSNMTRSVTGGGYEGQKDNTRHGKLSLNNWYVSQVKPKSISFPPIYEPPGRGYNTWPIQPHYQPNRGIVEHKTNFLSPKDILKTEEWVDILHTSLRVSLESLFDVLDKELKKKLRHVNPNPIFNAMTRSACIDTGDGSCEGESADDAFDAACVNNCSDDKPATANDPGNVPNDMSKRSESPLEYLNEALPVIVRAAETILGESAENKKSFGGGGTAEDDGEYDRPTTLGSGDGDAGPVPDDGTDNGKTVHWNVVELDEDHVPAV